MEDSIAIRDTIPALVKAYNEIEARIRSVYDSIDATTSLAYATFGDDARHRCIVPRDCDPYISKALRELRIAAWRYIMRRCMVVELISQERHKKLSKTFEDGDVPPFTEQNVFATMESIREGLTSMVQESIMEAYEILRPRHDSYKTNSEYKVGKRVILSGSNHQWMLPRITISTHREADLRAIDKALHLLDGKGVPKYPNDAATIIREALQDRLAASLPIDTPYFKVKCFRNGNIHLEFKRDDLVTELNRVAGGGMLNVENNVS